MPAVAREVVGFNLRGALSLQKKFFVYGAITIEAAADAVFAVAPINHGYYRIRWLDKTITEIGGGVWEFDVPYGLPEIPSIIAGGETGTVGTRPTFTIPGEDVPLGPEWSLDFSEGSVHIRQSIKYFGGLDWDGAAFPNDESPPPRDTGDDPYVSGAPEPRGRTIHVNRTTGQVGGLDIAVGSTRLQLTGHVPTLSMRYVKQKIRRLRGKVNSETFLHHDPGEIRFIGCQFGFKYADGISGVFTFDIIPNEENVRFSDQILLPFVRGWDFMEVEYRPAINPAGPPGSFHEKVYAVGIHQVYKYDDLNQLFTA